MSSSNIHRLLPGYFDNLDIEERVRQVFNTPVADWDTPQWITASVLLFLTLWCCGCICQQRRQRGYYRGYGGNGYHPNQQQPGLMTGGGGSSNNCLRNTLMCACCYEICCRDCQDIAPFLPGQLSAKVPAGEYQIHDMERGSSAVAAV